MLEEFAGRDHVVCGCATNEESIEDLRDEFPNPHHMAVVNVADNDEVADWIGEILQGGTPDLVVNNAAMINQSLPLWEVDSAEFAQLMQVNITGTFHVIKHLLPAMIEARSGVIVNFSSGWGRSTSPDVAPYCASKWAIEGLSRSLSQELPRGLAVVALNPGIIHTDMLDSCFGASASSFPSPDEWAQRAVPYLLSLDESDNGCSLDIPV